MSEGVKVGIISCSGEDFCEGTISRLATRKVLTHLRAAQTVTICLPLFLAGNEQERAFAQNYPTITVDGCAKSCARKGTEAHSGPVSAALIVTDILGDKSPLSGEKSYRRLSPADMAAVDIVAQRIAQEVDAVSATGVGKIAPADEGGEATCSCGRALPVGEVTVDGRDVQVTGLPLIFKQLANSGLKPDEESGPRLLEVVKVYHPVAADEEHQFQAALVEAFRRYHADAS